MNRPGGPARGLPPAARVVVVGGANVDVVGQALTPLSAGDSTPGEVHSSPGGVGRNIAENLARLGLQTHFYSAVGQDAWGDRLRLETQAAGVLVEGMVASPRLPTAQYLSLVQPDGSLCMALNDMRVLDELTPAVLRQHGLDLTGAAALVLDCNLSPDTLAWLMDSAQGRAALKVVVDAVSATKCTKIRPHLARIHTLKLNRLEAQALTGLAVHTLAEAQRTAVWLCQQGVQQTLVSLGDKGVCWCDGLGQVGHVPGVTTAIANTNGAGDALLAGVVYGQLVSLSWGDAVDCGRACAALTMASPTANAPGLTAAYVDAWLAGRKSPA